MSEERIQPEPGFWEWLAAVACFVLGALSLATGFVLTTDRLLDAHLHPSLHALGIVLLIIGIPVIILGGHFMDLGEKKNGHAVLALFGVLLLFSTFSTGQAQQTIFNVPTTDVLDKGKVSAELDASLKPTDGATGPKFSSFVPRVVVGAGSRVELGLNITGNIQPGPDSTRWCQPSSGSHIKARTMDGLLLLATTYSSPYVIVLTTPATTFMPR